MRAFAFEDGGDGLPIDPIKLGEHQLLDGRPRASCSMTASKALCCSARDHF